MRDVNKPIDQGPGNTIQTDAMTISGSGINISDLNVVVDLDHTWVGDLRILLVNESSGDEVVLINRPGIMDEPGFACDGQNLDLQLDDAASGLADENCTSGNPAIQGIFRPTTALSAFNGVSLNGTWTLVIQDNVPALDNGYLDKWCLIPNGIIAENKAPVIKDVMGQPISEADTFMLPHPDSLFIRILATDPEGHNVDVSSAESLTENGSTKLGATGDTSFWYFPNEGFIGRDTLRVILCDNGTSPGPACDTLLVFIDVEKPKLAIDDFKKVLLDTTSLILILDNDYQGGGLDTSSVVLIRDPIHGLAEFNADSGMLAYTPDAGFTGNDTARYRVCNADSSECDSAWVWIQVVLSLENIGPEARDDKASTAMNTEVRITVLKNDTDPDGTLIFDSLKIVLPPMNGTAIIQADSTIKYAPDLDYLGKDTFYYRICDDGNPALCDTARVTLNVFDPGQNQAPLALDDQAMCKEGDSSWIPVLVNDEDPEGLLDTGSVKIVVPPVFGTAASGYPDGSIVYRLDTGMNPASKDSFSYRICDQGTPILCDTAWVRMDIWTLGIGSRKALAPTLVPNPYGSGPLSVLSSTGQIWKGEATVLDLEGRIIWNGYLYDGNLDLGHLLPGTYLIHLKWEQQESIHRLLKWQN